MPKLKTKSGAKKRFKVTATGKVMFAHRGKRHGMIKRTKKQIRQLRGTAVLFKTDGDNVKKYFLPKTKSSLKDFCHVSRQTRCDRSRQAQESLQSRQGFLRPPQEHHPRRQAGRGEGPAVRVP
jgi:large subunit ribosomal protein L35